MLTNFDVWAEVKNNIIEVEIDNMTSLGGKDSSGIQINELNFKDDYVVLVREAEGVLVHCLHPKFRGKFKIEIGHKLEIMDLTILVTPNKMVKENVTKDFSTQFFSMLPQVDWLNNHEVCSRKILELLLSELDYEKGLIIYQQQVGDFKIVCESGVESNSKWLSESFFNEILQKKEPIVLSNVIGSRFDTKKSLIGTGFLSVLGWPIIFQNQILAIIFMGSSRPHSGLSDEQMKQIQSLVNVLSLMLFLYFRNMEKSIELDKMRSESNGTKGPLLTESPKLLETLKLAKRLSDSDISIFIHGETGVGKELLAKWIHQQSPRGQGPFVAVNCGAIPKDLIESFFFGHVKGAFTGAIANQIGKIKQANGGTLFLDEIGDLDLALQAKLLRVVQERVFEPVGSQKSEAVSLRVLSASHKNLKALVRQGKFREDLYFRLSEVCLEIPPLRSRPSDIGIIAKTFLGDIDDKKTFDPLAWKWLHSYEWPGNVRELKAVINKAAIISGGKDISIEDLNFGSLELKSPELVETVSEGSTQSLEAAKDAFVKKKIKQALNQTGGNRQRAAELLQVTPRTLFRYLEHYKSSDLYFEDSDRVVSE